ncbi:MAG: bifunctional glutamate N-acetyltransferase/amino-acid acetyltransferase ArgJ [Methanobacteriota archaeon]
MKAAIVLEGSIDDVKGFSTASTYVGLKRKRKDLALIVSHRPTTAAGVFTTNRVKAAPVVVTMEHFARGRARAIVANSGGANACTGERGLADARRMAGLAAELLHLKPEQVGVASTGIIGHPLPMDLIEPGIVEMAAKIHSGDTGGAAEAIMTTDSVPKQVLVEITHRKKTFRIGGIAKGSGMIHPNMATMLGFLATDCGVPPPLLRRALRAAVQDTFNMITVDGDTSTNDMVLVLANGASGLRVEDEDDRLYDKLRMGLQLACEELAKKIAADGEGASKLLEVEVRRAPSEKDAKLAARAIAGSNLVKAAAYGQDPNWGRVIGALGYSGADFDPERVDLYFGNGLGDVKVVQDGTGIRRRDDKLLEQVLASKELRILVDLKRGKKAAKAWGCDLTEGYVKENAMYTT